MDKDDKAAGQLRSTDLQQIIAAAPEGNEKQPTAYHALRNNYTSLMYASFLTNQPPMKMQLDHQISSNKISCPQIRAPHGARAYP